MAKIIFNEQGMVGIGKTDVDVSYFTNDTSLVTIQEISDAEFDSLIYGSKFIEINNNVASFADLQYTDASVTCTQEDFTNALNAHKEILQDLINKKPNHSCVSLWQNALTHANNIDVSSFGSNCVPLTRYLKSENQICEICYF